MPVSDRRDTTAVAEPMPQEPRTYALTGGRTTARHKLQLETQVLPGSSSSEHLPAEARHVLAACGERSVSVAEIAHTLARPVWAAKVLISDLLDAGVLVLPTTASAHPERDPEILLRVLEGLRRRA